MNRPEVLSEVRRLQGAADTLTTPCGAGQLVWRRWGRESGEPVVVLLHGGSGSWTHWLRNIGTLVAAGRQVLVPDLPGFGDSDAPPDGGDADAMLEPLEQGLTQILGHGACDLVGFSFGGMTAGMWLARHPSRGRRLVLVGAPAMGVVPERQFRLKGWRHLESEAARSAVHRHNLAELMFHDATLIDDDVMGLHVANVMRDRLPRRRLSATDVLARALREVPCPVHAIYGVHDALYRQWIHHLRGAFEAATPDFRGLTLIQGAGHWVQYEAPDAFDAALLVALSDSGPRQ